MAEKGAVDFWGLSEVPDQEVLNAPEQKIEETTGDEYTSRLSEQGHSDRHAIFFNNDRLESEPYSASAPVHDLGENFFEVRTVNVTGTIRSSLGVQINDNQGQSIVVGQPLEGLWKQFRSEHQAIAGRSHWCIRRSNSGRHRDLRRRPQYSDQE